MSEVTVMEPDQHVGHGPGEYTATCRACRMDGDLRRITEAARPAPRDRAYYGHARALLKLYPWTEVQARALETAANAGLNLREVVSTIHEARAEVGPRGKRR